jgi:hypothetical protein
VSNVVRIRRERGLIGSPHSVSAVPRRKLNRPGPKLVCDEDLEAASRLVGLQGHLGNGAGEEWAEVGPRELFSQGCLSAAPAVFYHHITCKYTGSSKVVGK